MFCDINAVTAGKFLQKSENIKPCGDKFEYVETIKTEDKFKIFDKNIPCKNSDITVADACNIFLNLCKNRNIKLKTVKAYKTFINAHIIPYFKGFILRNITVSDVENFRQCLQNKQISERRIKNILTFLNQIIKYFQNEGYIDKTCIFEVKRIADIPKRKIQILTPKQLMQLFKITNKKYPYLTPIIKNLILQRQSLNDLLTGSEQEKKHLKRKIRKDFHKIKQEMCLTNYMFDDLRFSNFV